MSSNDAEKDHGRDLRLQASDLYGMITFLAANGKTKCVKDFPHSTTQSDVEAIVTYLREYLPQAPTPLTFIVSIRRISLLFSKKHFFQINCKFCIKNPETIH